MPPLDAPHRSCWRTRLRQRWASWSSRIPRRTWQPRTSRPTGSYWPNWAVRPLAVCLLCQPGVETQKRQREIGWGHLAPHPQGMQPTNELSVAVNQELFLERFITLTSAWEVLRNVWCPSEYLCFCFVCCFVCVLFICLFVCLVEWMSLWMRGVQEGLRRATFCFAVS